MAAASSSACERSPARATTAEPLPLITAPRAPALEQGRLRLADRRVPGEHGSFEVVEQERSQRVHVPRGGGRQERRRIGPDRPRVLVPPPEGVGRAHAEVERDDRPPERAHRDRLEPLAPPRHQDRASGEERRNVRADPRTDVGELLRAEPEPPELVQRHDRGRRIGAAPAEAGGDRDPLVDLDPGAALGPTDVRERQRGDQGEVQAADRDLAGEPRRALDVDAEPVGAANRHDVGEADGDDEALEVVVPVLARTQDP